MSREPLIRTYVRDMYYERACISCRPTIPRGLKEIDESHACYAMKYLHMKPCTNFKRDEFLRLVQAEQDGLLTLKFTLRTPSSSSSAVDEPSQSKTKPSSQNNDDDWDEDDNGSSSAAVRSKVTTSVSAKKSNAALMSIADKLKSFYLKDEFSYTVEKWNEQRALIIDELLDKFLYPEMERELKAKLVAEAKEFIFKGTLILILCKKKENLTNKMSLNKPQNVALSLTAS